MPADKSATRSLLPCQYQGWPALCLRDGELGLLVVPSIGGRLMQIQLGAQELVYTQPALRGLQLLDDGSNWDQLRRDWSFPLWGGGKTWLAPESAWPGGVPHRDLDHGVYALTDQWLDQDSMGVELLSPVDRSTGLQIRRRIELAVGGQAWSVRHQMHHAGLQPIQVGLWDVLMLDRPGTVQVQLDGSIQPQLIADKGPYTELVQMPMLEHGAEMLAVHCDRAVEFKLGLHPVDAQVTVTLPRGRDELVYQRRYQLPEQARFAHGMPVEVFNAPTLPYFEVESHGPLCLLQPGESSSYTVYESCHRRALSVAPALA